MAMSIYTRCHLWRAVDARRRHPGTQEKFNSASAFSLAAHRYRERTSCAGCCTDFTVRKFGTLHLHTCMAQHDLLEAISKHVVAQDTRSLKDARDPLWMVDERVAVTLEALDQCVAQDFTLVGWVLLAPLDQH